MKNEEMQHQRRCAAPGYTCKSFPIPSPTHACIEHYICAIQLLMADDPSVQFDGAMAQRASAAEAANQVIRYVGSVDVTNGTAAIKVSRYVRTNMWGRCNVKITGCNVKITAC